MAKQTRYQFGSQFENELVEFLRSQGFPFVSRTPGSHTIADVVALGRHGEKYLIQCKRTHSKELPPNSMVLMGDRLDLYDTARKCDSTPIVVLRYPRKKPKWYVVNRHGALLPMKVPRCRMTVNELIEKLERFDPNLPVHLYDPEWGTYDLDCVDVSALGKYYQGNALTVLNEEEKATAVGIKGE